MLTLGLTDFAMRLQQGPAVLAGIAITACTGWMIVTSQQVGYRKNNETPQQLWLRAERKGQDEEAISHFRIQIRPDDLEAHRNLGGSAAGGRPDGGGCSQASRIASSEPNASRGAHRLGSTARPLGRTKEAAMQYQQAIDLKPEDAVAHSGWIDAQCRWDIQTKIFVSCTLVSSWIPTMPTDNLGVVLTMLGRIDVALPNFPKPLFQHRSVEETRKRSALTIITCSREGLSYRPLFTWPDKS
jgi:hypothetical protein